MLQLKKIIVLLMIVFGFQLSSAQINILNAKVAGDIGVKTEAQIQADNDKPLPYGYVDDRDILWSVEVWEVIDLNERANFPLLFPTDTLDVDAYRRSLYDVLLKNIKNGKIKDLYVDSYFTQTKSTETIEASLSKIDTLEEGYNLLNAGEALPDEYITRRNLESADIAQYHIRGIWYFDKRQGELKYRLLALAPVAPDVNFIDSDDSTMSSLVPLFWVFYPQVRDILHARPMSFDHLLNARMFSSVIYKEANVYGDRKIKDYIPDNALLQLLEADKIKEKIRDREQDMWTN